ncbi:uncharacterized protein K460DRAFT_266369, partial [Cucurbitaria berberidis CBS 394.84]
IWQQHALHMQHRYRASGLPDFAAETKLAFQKKVYDLHLGRESQLRKAYEDTANLHPPGEHATRKGVTGLWNTVLVTTQFSEHSMWDLISTKLWRYFENGFSWNLPQWVPRGILRIQTIFNASRVYFDFGSRTFSTDQINLPAEASTQVLFYAARCHETGADVHFGLAFLADGFVKVQFPALAVVGADAGCRAGVVVDTVVELTGVYM